MTKHTKEMYSAAAARVSYCASNGEFYWTKPSSNRVQRGEKAGTLSGGGYIHIGSDGRRIAAHRLAWFMIHGVVPEEQVDHINGIKDDNRICNLRLCNASQNKLNANGLRSTNRSGVRGVCWDGSRNRWAATIMKDGKAFFLGRFEDLIDAKKARESKEIELFGDFSSLNRSSRNV